MAIRSGDQAAVRASFPPLLSCAELMGGRFEKRIYIPLPEVQARRRMFELNVGNTPHGLTPSDFTSLAEQTDGWVRRWSSG